MSGEEPDKKDVVKKRKSTNSIAGAGSMLLRCTWASRGRCDLTIELSSCEQDGRITKRNREGQPGPTVHAERSCGNEPDQSHEAAHLLSQPPSAPSDIDTTDMDDIRKSLSKLKKDFKHRVGGKKRGQDGAGANTAEERVDSSASPLRPGPRVEEDKISTPVSQAYSTDPSPYPEPLTAEDPHNDPRWKEVDVDRIEASPNRSGLDADIENSAGSRPNREVKQASSSLPVAQIPLSQEPGGTRTLSPEQPCLITPLDNADTPAVPDSMQPDPRPNENAEPSAVANEKKSSWKSTALATAKLLLRGVRDSADAFGPLKSVAGGLCFILENCEVWPHPCLYYHESDRYPRE